MVVLNSTFSEHARSISRGKFVNKPNVLLSLSEDKTIIALDLAIPKQSQDKKTILLKRVGRCTQEI